MTRAALIASAASLIALAACGENGGSGAAGGNARAWDVDYAASSLTVTGDYGAVLFTGTFSDWTADIVFAPDDLDGSSIRADVQVASLESGDNDRDAASREARWLNAAAFPTATWQSTAIEPSGAGYLARGEFTVAGVTSPLELNFTVDIAGDTARASGSTSFDHHNVGITGGYDDPDTGDVFTVNFDIVAAAR